MNKVAVIFLGLLFIASVSAELVYNNPSLPHLSNVLNAIKNLVVNDLTANGNIVVLGNFSAKRPYCYAYDNSTQNFLDTAVTQLVNLSNNLDMDCYQIHIVNRQNITFDQTGDYEIIFMPEFFQASGNNKIITFWIEKNGVDIPFTNTRYTISNGGYLAPSITYQVDINNPATDTVRVRWWSDSTATQIISIYGLTTPTRPSIPGVIISIKKLSEVTS